MICSDMAAGYDVFVSYARRDNGAGRVSALVDKLRADFRAFAGRDLRVFFDTEEIRGMDDWHQRIQRALRDSHLFVAVLSNAYIASPYCRWEWTDYVRYEAMRQCLGDGVAPVFFVTLPETDAALANWIRDINQRQAFDLRPWYDQGESALKETHVARTLTDLQQAVRDRLDRAERGRRSPTNLMRHNPWFVGRVRELAGLRDSLAANKLGILSTATPAIATVQGVGGMGKTEVALAYAHAFAWDYPGGRWLIRSEGIADLRVALRQLAGPLAIEFSDAEARDLDAAFERVLREIGSRERMLIVFDNVTDGRLFDPVFVDRLPRGGAIDVIATTRLAPAQLPGSVQDLAFVAIDQLPEDDAVELLRSHQPNGQFPSVEAESAAREIAALLNGFTLAIETAGIYLGRHAASVSIGDFAADLKSRVLDASEAAAADPAVAVRHRERLLEATLAFTLDTLAAGESRLLIAASCLPADQIAVPWLTHVAAGDTDAVTASAAIDQLLGLRLLQTAGADSGRRVVRMHRLVQAVVMRRNPSEAAKAESALETLAHERAETLWNEWFDETMRWELDPLVAYTWQTLERDRPRATDMSSRSAGVLYRMARFADAEPLMRKTHEVNETRSGAASADAAASLGNLGVLLAETNRLDEAERCQRRALEIDESLYSADHPSVAIRMANLADVLVRANRLAEAEPYMRRALAINTAAYGPAAAEAAIPLNNLADLLRRLGKSREAETLMRHALDIDRRVLGDRHPDVALRLRNLGTMLAEEGRAADAEPLLREALQIEEARLGPDHPHVAGTLNSLAATLHAGGRSDDGEAMARRAVEIDEARYGSQHPVVANRLANLAKLLADQGREVEAEPVLRRALEILIRIDIATGNPPPELESIFAGYQSVLAQMGWSRERRQARLAEIYRALS